MGEIIWIIHITQVISIFKKGSTQIKKLAPILDLVTEFQELTECIFGGEGLKFSQYFSESLEPGIGFNIALTKSLGIQISSSFVKTKEETGITHFRHQAGIYFGLGTKRQRW